MRTCKKTLSVLTAVLILLTVITAGIVPGTVNANAASWNGYTYGGGTLYGYRTFLEAFGIDYDTYLKWMDDHDADSPNPRYYLGTPYVAWDHRNPHGDCQGAYGAYDVPGKEGLNCTGFVWHVLYKSAVMSGASQAQINRLQVMGQVPVSWANLGVYRIYFNSIEEAYASGVLEKGDLFWIYGTGDSHNAIFYGKNAKDFIYWDSAGKRNRYSEVHSIGTCLGLWVAKVTQPNNIELRIDASSGGGVKFGTKYCIFNSKDKAQAALDSPVGSAAWNKREGTIVLDKNGNGTFRQQSAPSAKELWAGDTPRTDLSYFSSPAKRVSVKNTYYAVQWSAASGMSKDTSIREFKDSGKRTSTGFRIYSFTAPIKVDTPVLSAVKSVSDGVKLTWKAVSGAAKYRIYTKNSNGGWTRVGETSSTSFIDTGARSGSAYTYTIRCLDKANNFISDYNRTGWKHTYVRLATPAVTSLTGTPDGVSLSWNAVTGAERYRVYRKNDKNSWTRLTETTAVSYTDKTAAYGATYIYTVRCADTAGDFTSDFNRDGWKITYKGVATPKISKAANEPEGIRLTWTPVSDGVTYRVYTKKKDGDWQRIGETNNAEYLDRAVTLNNSYTYTVRCISPDGKRFVSDFDRAGKSCTYTGAATPRINSAANEAEGIRLTWTSVGAARYRVYYQQNGSWTRIGETSETEFLDASIPLGDSRVYTVRCVSEDGKRFVSDFDRSGTRAAYTGVIVPSDADIPSDAVTPTAAPESAD